MKQRVCSRCKDIITSENCSSNKRNKDGLNCYCKPCLKARRLENVEAYTLSRKNNQPYYTRYAQSKRKERRERMVALFGGVCKECGGSFHFSAFDFHHKNSAEKEFKISDLMQCRWERVLDELKKCEMLCANCHRVLHFLNGGSIKEYKNGTDD